VLEALDGAERANLALLYVLAPAVEHGHVEVARWVLHAGEEVRAVGGFFVQPAQQAGESVSGGCRKETAAGSQGPDYQRALLRVHVIAVRQVRQVF